MTQHTYIYGHCVLEEACTCAAKKDKCHNFTHTKDQDLLKRIKDLQERLAESQANENTMRARLVLANNECSDLRFKLHECRHEMWRIRHNVKEPA